MTMQFYWLGSLSEQTVFFIVVLTVVAVAIWRYFNYVAPYSRFPSFRLDIQVLYWIFKRKPLKKYGIQKLLEVCRGYNKEGMCVIWCGEPVVFVYGEDFVKTFINEPEAVDKPKLYDIFKCFLGNAIFLCSGEKYKKFRKIMHPAFHLMALKGKIPIINRHAAMLSAKISEFNNITTDKTMYLLKESLLRIFFEASLGIGELNSPAQIRKVNRLIEVTQKLSEFLVDRMFKPWLHLDFLLPFIPSGRRSLKLHEEGCNLTMELLEELKHSMISSLKSSKKADDFENFVHKTKLFSEILLEEHLRDPSFTMKDVLDQTNSIMIAGYDTMGYILTWCLFLLGHNMDVQEQAYQEVKATTKEDIIHYEDLINLEYVDCIIKETLRLYPVFPMIARRLGKDIQCGKYTVPKDSTIAIFIHLLHRNPEIYPDPENFDPDRFRTNDYDSRIRQWNYIPFSEGIRGCPGKHFAMMEMKIILAHILRNFKVTSVDRKDEVNVSWEILLAPEKPIRLKFESRQVNRPGLSWPGGSGGAHPSQ